MCSWTKAICTALHICVFSNALCTCILHNHHLERIAACLNGHILIVGLVLLPQRKPGLNFDVYLSENVSQMMAFRYYFHKSLGWYLPCSCPAPCVAGAWFHWVEYRVREVLVKIRTWWYILIRRVLELSTFTNIRILRETTISRAHTFLFQRRCQITI